MSLKTADCTRSFSWKHGFEAGLERTSVGFTLQQVMQALKDICSHWRASDEVMVLAKQMPTQQAGMLEALQAIHVRPLRNLGVETRLAVSCAFCGSTSLVIQHKGVQTADWVLWC